MENIYLKNWRHFDRTIKGLLIRDAMTGELLYDGDNDDAAEMIMQLAKRCEAYEKAFESKNKQIDKLTDTLTNKNGILNKLILNAKKQGIVIDGSDYAELLNMLFDNGYDPFKNYDGDE